VVFESEAWVTSAAPSQEKGIKPGKVAPNVPRERNTRRQATSIEVKTAPPK